MTNGGSNERPMDKLWTALVNAGSAVVVVIVALIVLSFMTSYLVSAVDSDDAKLAIATAALGVIGTVIGAFFGVKSATDSRKDVQEQTKDQVQTANEQAKDANEQAKQANEKLVAVARAADPNDDKVKEALGG